MPRKDNGLRSAGWALAAAIMLGGAALAQSTNPVPGASLGDDYAPTPAFRQQAKAPAPGRPSAAVDVQVVASGLVNPWGLAFLPDGRMLVTERPGRLRLVSRDGRLSEPLGGVPAVRAIGTKGLHDVALDPDFARNRMVYLSYFALNPARAGTLPATAYTDWLRMPYAEREAPANKIGFESVGRGRLSDDGARLENFQVILRAPSMGARRLVFRRDGTLLVTADTPGAGALPTGGEPQQLDNLYGKILRINRDGSIPRDNPLRNRAGARPEIWAWGFRDPEGATLDPRTGELWTVENGPRGGDELNRVRAGRNYGFPAISYGLDFERKLLGTGKLQAPGMEQPVYFWTPSIALSGLTIYDGRMFPQWRGDIFTGGLISKKLVRLDMEGGRVRAEEALLVDRDKRIRDVRQGPDGALWVLTDEAAGEIWRVTPRR